jgi:tetratricopeptide (TPR) repeat protein
MSKQTIGPTNTEINNLIKYYTDRKFNAAIQLASSITKRFPKHQFTWKILGILFSITRRIDEAIDANKKAIDLFPGDNEAHNNLGNNYKSLRKLNEAERCYKEAIKLKPEYVDANYNMAHTLQQLQRLEEAEKFYRKVINLKPNHLEALFYLGNTLRTLNKLNEAERCYKKIINLKPDFSEAYNNLAITIQELGRLNEAEKYYRKAIELNPDYIVAYNNLGIILRLQKKFNESEKIFKNLITLKPDFSEAYNNLAITIQELGRLNEAEKYYRKAIELNPDYIVAYNNLTENLKETNNLDEAKKIAKLAIDLNPNHAQSYNSQATINQELGNLNEAEKNYKKAISLDPQNAEINFNYSTLLNLKGDFKKGLEMYEWRIYDKKFSIKPPDKSLSWDGIRSIKNKKFLVYQEQGIGDTFQFFRYLNLLQQKGAEIYFKVKKNLQHFFISSSSNIKIIDSFDDYNKIDYEIPLMSLPYLFKTEVKSIPAKVPYLMASNDKMIKWGKVLNSSKFKIGICWQGSKNKIDRGRSFPLLLFKDISKIPNIELISLYKGENENDYSKVKFNLKTLGPDFDNGKNAFIDTAAVMMHCDLIITSDTAIAHLAGALGRPVWVALKYIPEWRWLLNRSDSPWYPTMTLYRQNDLNNWNSVFEKIKKDLETIINNKKF